MACRVSIEKSDILLLEDPLYMRIPCCFQDFIFVFQQFNFSVSCAYLFAQKSWNLSGCVDSCVLLNLESLGLLFLQTSFCSFFSTLFLGLPSRVCCRCPRLCFPSLFSSCSPVFNLKTPILKFADPKSSLAVQWLGLHAENFTAKGVGSVPGQGTKVPQASWQGL